MTKLEQWELKGFKESLRHLRLLKVILSPDYLIGATSCFKVKIENEKIDRQRDAM